MQYSVVWALTYNYKDKFTATLNNKLIKFACRIAEWQIEKYQNVFQVMFGVAVNISDILSGDNELETCLVHVCPLDS